MSQTRTPAIEGKKANGNFWSNLEITFFGIEKLLINNHKLQKNLLCSQGTPYTLFNSNKVLIIKKEKVEFSY